MRLEEIRLHHVQIPLKTRFEHASHSRAVAEFAVVAIADEAGRIGYGEVQPRPYVTGETLAEVLGDEGRAKAQAWVGRSVPDFQAAIALAAEALDRSGRRLALQGGFELALLDLAGQRYGRPISAALQGTEGPPLPGGVVIGFEIGTAALKKHCALLKLAGKRFVKVKVGREDDALRLAEIAAVLKDVPLRLDANEAWGVEEAIEKIRSFKGISIASVEQPVAAADWAGLREIRSGTGVPIMADESLITLGDAMNLADQGAADVFHIRLGKLGGLLGAQRVVELAQQRGIGLHLGTMVGESGILTRASEVFGRLYQGFDCFDGKGQNRLLLSEDLLADPRQAEEAGLDVPGLGVQVDPARLSRLGTVAFSIGGVGLSPHSG